MKVLRYHCVRNFDYRLNVSAGQYSFCFLIQSVAASCIWLAAKLEENFRKAKDVIVVFHRMEQRRNNLPIEPFDPFSTVCSFNYFSHIIQILSKESLGMSEFSPPFLITLSGSVLEPVV